MTGHAGRYRRLAERLPGAGSSGSTSAVTAAPPGRRRGRIDAHVADLVETAEALGVPGGAAWVGHSFGGRLVAELAAREPERVERAVLLDPALHVDPQVATERAALLRDDVSFASPDEAIDTRLGDGSLFTTPRATPGGRGRAAPRARRRRAVSLALLADGGDRGVERDVDRAAAVAALPDPRRGRRAVLDPGSRPAPRQPAVTRPSPAGTACSGTTSTRPPRPSRSSSRASR